MSKFRKQHYNMIADVLRASYDPTISDAPARHRQLIAVVEALCTMFRMDNPDFDDDRFYDAVQNGRKVKTP